MEVPLKARTALFSTLLLESSNLHPDPPGQPWPELCRNWLPATRFGRILRGTSFFPFFGTTELHSRYRCVCEHVGVWGDMCIALLPTLPVSTPGCLFIDF